MSIYILHKIYSIYIYYIFNIYKYIIYTHIIYGNGETIQSTMLNDRLSGRVTCAKVIHNLTNAIYSCTTVITWSIYWSLTVLLPHISQDTNIPTDIPT